MGDTFAIMAKSWDREPFDRMLKAAKENGYKKKEIAEMLGIFAPTLSDWVKGDHAPHANYQAQFPKLEAKFIKHPRKKGGKR